MPGYEEGDHPRDEKGQFSESAGGGAAKAWASKARITGERALPHVALREATPHEFAAAFGAAFKDSPFRDHVTHYTPDQLKDMKCLLSEDGKSGVAIHDHGDGRVEATALFNQGTQRGAGLAILEKAISQHGANYVECYGPVLNKMYEQAGFKEATRDPFEPKYAAPGWDHARFDSPDYVTMRL